MLFGLIPDHKSGKQKAKELLLSGQTFTSKEMNKILGWKFATRISEAIKELREEGYEIEKGRAEKKFRTYHLKAKEES